MTREEDINDEESTSRQEVNMNSTDLQTPRAKILGDFTWPVSKWALSENPLLCLQKITGKLLGVNGANDQHEYERKKIKNIYLSIMMELLSRFTVENLAISTVTNDDNFREECMVIAREPENLKVWKDINPDLEFFLNDQPQIVRSLISQWRRHVELLQFYFSSESKERDLLFSIQQWLLSPTLSRHWYLKWMRIYQNSRENQELLRYLRKQFMDAPDKEPEEDDRLYENFKMALGRAIRDIENHSLSREATQNIDNYLHYLFELQPQDERENSEKAKKEKKLVFTQRLMLLSQLNISQKLQESEEDGVMEIVLCANHTLFVDCSIEKKNMHGKNLSIVAGTVVILRNGIVFDVSGLCACGGSIDTGCFTHRCRISRANRLSVSAMNNGIDGLNGKSGESSGNIAIVAAKMKNEHYLSVKLNGGNGEGGQDGGKGGNGLVGKGVTQEELKQLCLKYRTMYWKDREDFKKHEPGNGFTRTGDCANGEQFFVNKFENLTDGRKIEFSFAKHTELGLGLIDTVDLYFLIRGGNGTAPGVGGRQGLGGGGGRGGEFIAKCTSTEEKFNRINVEQNSGEDGQDGKEGRDGDQGRNGNDLVMIDRSTVTNGNHFVGDASTKLNLKFHPDQTGASKTRLNGYLRDREEACFVEFTTAPIDLIPALKEHATTVRNERALSHSKPNIILGKLRTNYESNEKIDILLPERLRFEDFNDVDREVVEEEVAEESVSVLRDRIEKPRKQNDVGNHFKEEERFKRIVEWREKKRSLQTDSSKYEVTETFDVGDDVLHDVCELPLDSSWSRWDSKEYRDSLIGEFEEKVKNYYCNDEVLGIIKSIRRRMEGYPQLETLRNYVEWHDKDAVNVYFEHLNRSQSDRATRRGGRGGQANVDDPLEEKRRALTEMREKVQKSHDISELLEALKEASDSRIKMLFSLKPNQDGSPEIGGDIATLLFIYFSSKEVVETNEDLRRYHEVERSTLSPCKSRMDPKIDDILIYFRQNGIRSVGYLHLLSDREKINIQVFLKMSPSKMRRIANINEGTSPVHRLFYDESGGLFSVGLHHNAMRMKSLVARSVDSEISLPHSDPCFQFLPKGENRLQEIWKSSAKLALSSETDDLDLLQYFELLGAYMSSEEVIFVLNSCMNLVCNHGVHLSAIEKFIASASFENLSSLMLKLRILAETAELDGYPSVLDQLSDGRSASIIGSRLHEMDSTLIEQKMETLVTFLSDSTTSSDALETMSLKELVSRAENHRAIDVAESEQLFGHLGYYVDLLQLKHDNSYLLNLLVGQLKELREDNRAILPKAVALITNLLCNGERDSFGSQLELKEVLCLESHHKGSIPSETEQQARIAELCKENRWKTVFPDEVRSLDEVGKFSINTVFTEEKTGEIIRMLRTAESECVKLFYKIEAAILKFRNIQLRDTQKFAVLCGYLHDKNLVSQITTGEGKTLIIVALSILYIKLDRKSETRVDVITSSSVLAKRDAEDYCDIYAAFGIRASHNCEEDIEKRKQAYAADVVYGDIAYFQRDFLMHVYYQKNILGNRRRDSTIVIVDEVDSMLLDHGSNMLYLSHNVTGLEMMEPLFVFIQKLIQSAKKTATVQSLTARIKKAVLFDLFGMMTTKDIRDLGVNAERTSFAWDVLTTNSRIINNEGVLQPHNDKDLDQVRAKLTRQIEEECAQKVMMLLEMIKNRRRVIYIPEYLHRFTSDHLDEFVASAVTAIFLKKDDEYVIDMDRTQRSTDLHPVVTIIDKGTGTDLGNSQWTNGLHQFLQIKHGCHVTPLSLKAIFVSNVTYLKGYRKINGLSGTLGSEKEKKCLTELYDADVMRIPTCKPRMFSEDVPVVAATEEEWARSIYNSTKDKLLANRSVLIICSTIMDVDNLNSTLPSLCNSDPNNNDNLLKSFGNSKLYRRDFEIFDIEEGGLSCGTLIISTNLAGRGTDIRLCEELERNGGLHVIVGLCDNKRIEDQAFGRAARCGDYGSGQIIALASGKPNIFTLLKNRDLVEEKRLQSLKNHYDYNVNVQEECLRRFQEHCRDLLKSVQSQDDFSSPTHIQYFALLDKWALMLDKISQKIVLCERRSQANETAEENKMEIIEDVEKQLWKHGLNMTGLKPPSWIDRPQPLIQYAVILFEKRKHEEAFCLLSRVLRQFPDFVGEASYYLGIFKLQDKEKSEEAAEHLLLARTEFLRRMEREAQMRATVEQLIRRENAGGYGAQKQEAAGVWKAFIDTIDRIVGRYASDADLTDKDENDELFQVRRKVFTHAGFLTPPVLQDSVSLCQLTRIAAKYSLPSSMLKNFIDSIRNDENLPEYEDRKIFDVQLLSQLPLPNSAGFWECLQKAGVFNRERHFIAVKKGIQNIDLPSEWIVTKIVLEPLDIRLNHISTDEMEFYELQNFTTIEDKPDVNSRLYELVSAKLAHFDIVGTVNPDVILNDLVLEKYDFVTASILMEELRLDLSKAKWILETLEKHGILKRGSISDGAVRFVKKGRLDFSMFPEGMQEPLWTVFTRHFSYGYALKFLRASVKQQLTEGKVDGEKMSYQIPLASSPYSELFDDLVKSGIVIQSTVSSLLPFYQKLQSNVIKKSLFQKLEPLAPKLEDHKFTMEKTQDYMRKQGVLSHSTVKNAISSGLVKTVNVEHRNVKYLDSWKSWFHATILKFGGRPLVTVEAQTGSLHYFTEMTKENQKQFAGRDATLEEEFKEFRKNHEQAVRIMNANLNHSKKIELAQRTIDDRTISIKEHILRHSVVTHCQTTVSEEYFSNCMAECSLLPMLKEAIDSFLMFTIREDVVGILQAIDNNQEPKLQRLENLYSVIAFARAVVIDVNKPMQSSLNQEAEATATLNPDDVSMEIVKKEADSITQTNILNPGSLQSVMTRELHRLLEDMVDDTLRNKVQPMVKKMVQYWEEEVAPSLVYGDKYDEECFEDDEEEPLDIHGRHSYHFRDLINIFLKITFNEQKPAIVAHMVKYNFPLGTHCALLIGKGLIQIMQSADILVDRLKLDLHRGSESVCQVEWYKCEGGSVWKKFKLELESNCFYAGNDIINLKKESSLFEAVTKQFPEISKKFFDDKAFLNALSAMISDTNRAQSEVDREWKHEIRWTGAEEFRCAVKL